MKVSDPLRGTFNCHVADGGATGYWEIETSRSSQTDWMRPLSMSWLIIGPERTAPSMLKDPNDRTPAAATLRMRERTPPTTLPFRTRVTSSDRTVERSSENAPGGERITTAEAGRTRTLDDA